jgi:hypothetical protein
MNNQPEEEKEKPITLADLEKPVFDGPPDKEPPMLNYQSETVLRSGLRVRVLLGVPL